MLIDSRGQWKGKSKHLMLYVSVKLQTASERRTYFELSTRRMPERRVNLENLGSCGGYQGASVATCCETDQAAKMGLRMTRQNRDLEVGTFELTVRGGRDVSAFQAQLRWRWRRLPNEAEIVRCLLRHPTTPSSFPTLLRISIPFLSSSQLHYKSYL